MAEDIVIIVYFCLLVPNIFAIGILNGRSRVVFGYMFIGITMGLIASQINPVLLELSSKDYYYVTTNLTPICEELLKAIPVLFFAFEVSENKEDVVSIAFAVGLGFAVFENTVILIQSDEASIAWILARGIGAGLMHGVCTAIVGWGITLITISRRMFLPGIFSLLSLAIIYHGIFNTFVQVEQYKYFIIGLPIITYIILIILSPYRKEDVVAHPEPIGEADISNGEGFQRRK